MTEFIVLKAEKQGDSLEDLWRFVNNYDVLTAEAAIRAAAVDHDSGTYVAVARRRFDPKVVQTQQVTKVKLS